MMLKGANANVVTGELAARGESTEDVARRRDDRTISEPFSTGRNRNISTVVRNLIEGAIIVFLVLIIFLGDVRAGLIVASVIPPAMLLDSSRCGYLRHRQPDESRCHRLWYRGRRFDCDSWKEYWRMSTRSTTLSRQANSQARRWQTKWQKVHCIVMKSATFAALIILIVFCPILVLSGIEGKYTPMAKTLVFCIIEPVAIAHLRTDDGSIFLKRKPAVEENILRQIRQTEHHYKKSLTSVCATSQAPSSPPLQHWCSRCCSSPDWVPSLFRPWMRATSPYR